MRMFARPEVFIMMMVVMIGVGYLFTLIKKKQPKKKRQNPYRRASDQDDRP